MTNRVVSNITELIGGTPVVRLNRVTDLRMRSCM